ncbi:transcriptional coactivator p15/PC4 family protein [Roseovarius sp.]|uniref:transcriptional coactivator p15/PC4 family protein n=1 Tax=Roseovarius sp. TaxID=1486281 RepID=UPI003BAD201C
MIDLAKNKREIIRVRQREYGGYRYIDARIFFPGDDGEMRPVKQGVTIALDRAGELAAAIEQVARQEAPDDD